MLDEPTTGADVRTRTQLLELVANLAANGSAVVYSTHYLNEIDQLGASVLIIDQGRAIARGTVAELAGGARGQRRRDDLRRPGTGGERRAGSPIASNETAPSCVSTLASPMPRPPRSSKPWELRRAGLRTLEVVHPSLEAVFLELTGRRYEPAGRTEMSDVR